MGTMQVVMKYDNMGDRLKAVMTFYIGPLLRLRKLKRLSLDSNRMLSYSISHVCVN